MGYLPQRRLAPPLTRAIRLAFAGGIAHAGERMVASIPVCLAEYGAIKGLAVIGLLLVIALFWDDIKQKRARKREQREREERRRQRESENGPQ